MMKRFLFTATLLALSISSVFAQTAVQFGLQTGTNPRNLCVYDNSSSRQCVTMGAIDSTAHTFTVSLAGATIPVTSITGLGTGVATFLATPTSANLAAAVSDENGSGTLVFGTSPTLTTPVISGGTIDNASIGATTPSSGQFTTLSANTVTSTTPVLSFSGSNTIAAFGTTTPNSYNQMIIQNKSASSGASSNYVISNDKGTDSSYYGEFGMNSSVFSVGTPSDFYSINNGVYFSGHDGDISVGSGNGYKLYFPYGSTGASAHVINASGALGFNTNLGSTPATSGTTGFGTSGQALISAGSAAPPAWGTLGPSGGGTGITSLGTGVATALGTAVNGSGAISLSTSPAFVTPNLGTPSAAVLTNATGLPVSGVAAIGTNTVVGNATNGSASPTALSMTSCSTSASAVTWTTNTGFGCNTAVNASTLGGATFAAPGPIGSTTASTGAFTTLTGSTSILSSGAGGVGYTTGSGGTVTQATSRTTGVTLNKTSGAITLFTTTGSVTATTFTVTDSTVGANDTISLSEKSGTNLYILAVTAVTAGSFNITFYTTGGVASDSPVINFNVIKGSAN